MRNYENDIEKMRESHEREKQDYEKVIKSFQDTLKKQRRQNATLKQALERSFMEVQKHREQEISILNRSEMISGNPYSNSRKYHQNQNEGQPECQRSERNSISNYSANTKNSSSSRYLLGDNKNIENLGSSNNQKGPRKSTQSIIVTNNGKKYREGARVIDKDEDYNGIRKYPNVKY